MPVQHQGPGSKAHRTCWTLSASPVTICCTSDFAWNRCSALNILKNHILGELFLHANVLLNLYTSLWLLRNLHHMFQFFCPFDHCHPQKQRSGTWNTTVSVHWMPAGGVYRFRPILHILAKVGQNWPTSTPCANLARPIKALGMWLRPCGSSRMAFHGEVSGVWALEDPLCGAVTYLRTRMWVLDGAWVLHTFSFSQNHQSIEVHRSA